MVSLQSFQRGSLALILACTVALSGCASTGSSFLTGGSVSADPRLTQNSDAEFFSRSGYQACAVAALAGVLACGVSNAKNKAVCMVAAGVAACGVAMGANYYLDQRRSEYKNTAERLNAMGEEVREDTRKVQARTATVLEVIKDDQQRLASIKSDMQRQQLDKAAAQKDVARIDKNLQIMRRDLDNMNNKVANYRDVADAEKKEGTHSQNRELDVEIAKMNTQVASLQQEVDSLFEQRSAITLG